MQYSINGDLNIRSLGLIELNESHTASFLAKVTKDLFGDITDDQAMDMLFHEE